MSYRVTPPSELIKTWLSMPGACLEGYVGDIEVALNNDFTLLLRVACLNSESRMLWKGLISNPEVIMTKCTFAEAVARLQEWVGVVFTPQQSEEILKMSDGEYFFVYPQRIYVKNDSFLFVFQLKETPEES